MPGGDLDVFVRDLFHRILSECGENPPTLTSVHYKYDHLSCDFIITARYMSDDGERRVLSNSIYIPNRLLQQFVRPLMTEGELDCFAIWSQMYENHLMRLGQRRQREYLNQLTHDGIPPNVRDLLAQQMAIREEHLLEHHTDFNIPEFQARSNMTATEVRMRVRDAEAALDRIGARVAEAALSDISPEYRDRIYQESIRRLSRNYNPDGTVGSKEAQQKGRELLNGHLTKKQREQFQKKKYFEVKGGKTGKTYRIHQGRQMNIAELNSDGELATGWCFLPQGGLVSGDVMLAQKMALELYEEEALKVAHMFPAEHFPI